MHDEINIEATGAFNSLEGGPRQLEAGAMKVVQGIATVCKLKDGMGEFKARLKELEGVVNPSWGGSVTASWWWWPAPWCTPC